jgi:general secretion pathway protein G
MPLGRRLGRKGLTLIELLSVLTIIATLAGIAMPKMRETIYVAQVAKAIGDLRVIGQEIDAVVAGGGALPADLSAIGRGGWLDPWGNPYQYLPFPVGKGGGAPGGARKDRFLVPINSEYDLYSMGRDGKSVPPLTAATSRDDIVRANDGGFIGLASKY